MQWTNHTPEGSFPVVCRGDAYAAMIGRYGGPEAEQQWRRLEARLKPLQQGAALFPAAALRNDAGTAAALLLHQAASG